MIVADGCVALIERVRAGRTYYLFPGGGTEPGESASAAAVREAKEELGVDVRLAEKVYEEEFAGFPMTYFRAEIAGGEFGTGIGLAPPRPDLVPQGTYAAVWLPLGELASLDVRPPELARLLTA